MQETGARIRRMRLAKGLTLRQVSRLCGIPPSTLSNIESKDHAISLKNLMRIASALGVVPAALLAGGPAVTEEKVPSGHRLTYQREGVTAERLTPQPNETGLHVFLLTYEKGTRRPWAEPHPGWVYLFILDGEAQMEVEGEEPVRLRRDDFFYFRADRPNIVHAIERTSVVLVGLGVGLPPGEG